ncbi:MAG: arsenic resistance protein ArsH, partial [Pseudohongiellaceae bacterium]
MKREPKALPNLNTILQPDFCSSFMHSPTSQHPPKILLLYGSLRETSYSRLVIEECALLLDHMGAE